MGYFDEKQAIDIYKELCNDRIIRLDGEVNEESARLICSLLTIMDNNEAEKGKPIYLYINSPGGSIYDGLAIIDTMRTISSPVYTVCYGLAASMGAAILSSGDKRYCTKYSTVMIHQASSGARGNIQDIEVSVNETKRLNDLLAQIIADNCKKTRKEYLKATERDYFLDAAASLKFGIIDEILEYKNKVEEDR